MATERWLTLPNREGIRTPELMMLIQEHGKDYARIWDEATVRWRLANPSVRYALHARGERCEVRSPSGRPGVAALLGEVPRAWAGDPAQAGRAPGPFSIFIGADPELAWGRSFYWNLPQRLRPLMHHRDILTAGLLERLPQRRLEPVELG